MYVCVCVYVHVCVRACVQRRLGITLYEDIHLQRHELATAQHAYTRRCTNASLFYFRGLLLTWKCILAPTVPCLQEHKGPGNRSEPSVHHFQLDQSGFVVVSSEELLQPEASCSCPG